MPLERMRFRVRSLFWKGVHLRLYCAKPFSEYICALWILSALHASKSGEVLESMIKVDERTDSGTRIHKRIRNQQQQ